MTVAERRAQLHEELRWLAGTPCENCGHPFRNHASWRGGHCGCARYGDEPVICRCRRFVDPSEVLSPVNEPTQKDLT